MTNCVNPVVRPADTGRHIKVKVLEDQHTNNFTTSHKCIKWHTLDLAMQLKQSTLTNDYIFRDSLAVTVKILKNATH